MHGLLLRPTADSNADLASLALSAGTLTPPFASGTTAYTVSVPNDTNSMILVPTADQSEATIEVNGLPTFSGVASSAFSLAVGNNTFTVAVTAQNGVTVKNYIVTVMRGPSLVPQDVTQPGDPIVSSHPADRSPAAEGVANAIDNDPNTKYLNTGDHAGFFPPQSGITGLTVTPRAGASVLAQLILFQMQRQGGGDIGRGRVIGREETARFDLPRIGVEDLQSLGPGRLLGIIELSQIQQRLLIHRARRAASVLHDAKVAVFLAVLLPFGRTQKHG